MAQWLRTLVLTYDLDSVPNHIAAYTDRVSVGQSVSLGVEFHERGTSRERCELYVVTISDPIKGGDHLPFPGRCSAF